MSANSNLFTVTFRNHVMPDEMASRKAGRPIFNEQEVCDISFAGNTKTKATFPAHDAEPNATREHNGREGLGVITYAMLYNEQYRAFKNGEAQPLSGTPLSEAPFLKESKRRELKALNIHTVEALAALDGTPLKQIGMGGRELKNQAKAYLEAAAGSADVTHLAAENTALKDQVAELQSQMAEMIAAAKASAPAKQPAREPDYQGDVATADAEVPADDDPGEDVDPKDIDYSSWSDEELKDFIAQETGQRPKGNPSHKTLVAAAEELAQA